MKPLRPIPFLIAVVALAVGYWACAYGSGPSQPSAPDASPGAGCVEYTFGVLWPCDGSGPDQASPVDTSYDAGVGPAPQGAPSCFQTCPTASGPAVKTRWQ